MKKKPILVVDDEANIRLTMSRTLQSLASEVHTAVNGEEAVEKVKKTAYGLIFLDLKLPGMDGLSVLEKVSGIRPSARVIMITAHGSIDSAVSAMKLGSVDFLQKPFSPSEIRKVAEEVLHRERMDEEGGSLGYPRLIELAKRSITDRNLNEAMNLLLKAIVAKPGQPEAFNLLGAIHEIRGETGEAAKYYRASLDFDSGYRPAQANLMRVTSYDKEGSISMDAKS